MSVSAYDHDHLYLNNAGIQQVRQAQPLDSYARVPLMAGALNGQQPAPNANDHNPQQFQRAGGPNTVQYRGVLTNMPYSAYNPNSLNLAVPVRELTPEPEIQVTPVQQPEAPSTSTEPPLDEYVDDNIDIQIRNVVCNYTLPLHIDLRRLALNSNNVTFDKGRGVLLKQKRNPNCYVKIYSSGKVYIVGCKSEDDCMRAARTVARHVQRCMEKLDQEVRIRNYKVCNVLATCRMPFGIKIEELAQKYPQQSQYEPELSVGLVWRSQNPKATLRIHTTGSITVTGAASENDVATVLSEIYPIVASFRCTMRHRPEVKRKARKRPQPSQRGPPAKRYGGNAMQSGVVGNRVYFSDEDDLYEEDDLDDMDD